MTLIELIQQYGYSLEQRGLEWWGCCPFHKESKPSFSVTNKNGEDVWYCFGCKMGGGPAAFIAQHDHLSSKEAARRWAKLCGREVDQRPDSLLDDAVRLWIEQIGAAAGFLESRGIAKDTAARYRIGYCDSYADTLELLGATEEEAAAVGLFDVSGMVIFPFFDADGVYKIHARSVNSKEYRTQKGPLWRNGLWGLEQRGDDQPRGAEVYLFEGFFDSMAAAQAQLPSACMVGTVFHREYWEELRERNVRDVKLVPDGDDAGRRLLRSVLAEKPEDFRVSFVVLESGDPDDLLLSGEKLPAAQHPLEWYVGDRWGDVYSLDQKVRMCEDIARFYARMPRWEQELFRAWFGKKYGQEVLDYLYSDVKPNLQAEELVLGNCLYSEQAKSESLRVLSEECFHTEKMREVFGLVRDGEATPELVRSKLGVELRVDLSNYKVYLDEVSNTRTREQVSMVLGRARGEALRSSVDQLVGGVVEDLYRVCSSEMDLQPAGSVVRSVMASLNERVKNPQYLGVPFSEEAFPTLNRVLLGYVPGKLILLSGITGHGKTNVACNWVDDLVLNRGVPTLFFTLEMTPAELIERQLTIKTGISGAKLMTGSLEQSEYDHVLAASRELLDRKLWMIHGVYDLHRIVSMARSQIMRHSARVIFVDYVQLMTVKSRQDRWEQLMEITKMFKTRICSLGATVVLVSQLRKAALQSEIPEAADQAGSFGMLADADVAITIKRRSAREIKEGSNFLLYVDKHRYGVDNVLINAVFDRQTLRIREA